MNTTPTSYSPLSLIERWSLDRLPGDSQFATESSKIDAAISAGFAQGDEVADWWAEQLGLAAWDRTLDAREATKLAEKVPFEFAMDHLILLLAHNQSHYRCLIARP